MPHKQPLSARSKAKLQAWQALELNAQGLSIRQVAARMGCSTDTAHRALKRALSSDSSFPTTLGAEEVNRLRQSQSEVLLAGMARTIEQSERLRNDDSIPNDRKLQGQSAALKALALANVRLAEMNGLNAPTKIVEESLRVQINKNEVTGRIDVHLDREQLRPAWTPLGIRDSPPERLTNGGQSE